MSEDPAGQADNDVPPTHTPYPHTLTFGTFVKRYVPALKAAAEQGQRLPFPSKARFMGTLKLHGYNATIVFFPPFRTPSIAWVFFYRLIKDDGGA